MTWKDEVQVQELRTQLGEIRKASLVALNHGDYKKVAKLTVEAARLNQTIFQLAGPNQDPMLTLPYSPLQRIHY